MSRFAVVLLSFSLLVCFAAAQTQAQAELRIANCKSTAQSLSDCDTTGYVTRVAVFTIPGIIVAGLIFLMAPMYLIGKYCCNCCGGREQSPNFCCPADDLEARYSKGDLIRPRVILFLALLVVIGAFVWAYIGATPLVTGLNDMGDEVKKAPTTLRVQINNMEVACTVNLYDASTDTTTSKNYLRDASYSSILSEANKTLNELDDMISGNVGTVQEQMKTYSFIIYLFFAIPVVLLFFAVIFSLCSVRRYGPMLIVWLCFLFAVIVWICHAVFCTASMVAADGCTEIHAVAYQQQSVLIPVTGCKDSMFGTFTSSFQTLRQDMTKGVCNMVKPSCYDEGQADTQNFADKKVLVCPSPMDCNTVTLGQLVVWTQTALYIHPNINSMGVALTNGYTCETAANRNRCYLDLCQWDCRTASGLSDVGKAAKQQYSYYLAARKIANAMDTIASQYSSCESVFNLLIAPLNPSCDKIVTGLIQERQAAALCGIGMIAAIFAIAWGAKRNLPLSQADVPQHKEDGVAAVES